MADNRVHVSVRLGQKGLEWLDRIAHEHHQTRTEVLRCALIVAKKYEAELIKQLKDF